MLLAGKHLSYCSNVHHAGGMKGIEEHIYEYMLPIRERYARGEPFALGLRLSAEDARELSTPARFERLERILSEHQLSVSTLNGFVHGTFHGEAVKEKVFAPDWQDPERTAYTMDLVRLLVRLLPEGGDGSISTMPFSYKPWVESRGTAPGRNYERVVSAIIAQLVPVLSELYLTYEESGRLIHLDFEPEAQGLVETASEVTSFFKEFLFRGLAGKTAYALGMTRWRAEELVQRYLRVCYDTCHQAVQYETPAGFLDPLLRAGIRVGKLQVSSALRIPLEGGSRRALKEQLRWFAGSSYLHQVLEAQSDGSKVYLGDLREALATLDATRAREWRVHFHVPIHLAELGSLATTQNDIAPAVKLLLGTDECKHFEIETYTWDVLPEKDGTLLDSMKSEWAWLLALISGIRTETPLQKEYGRTS